MLRKLPSNNLIQSKALKTLDGISDVSSGLRRTDR